LPRPESRTPEAGVIRKGSFLSVLRQGKTGDFIMQEQDFEYFIQNTESFYRQYGHKFFAIKNKTILGVYDSFKAALDETLKKEPVGTFIIQECFKNKEESVNHFQGNVMLVPA
jgi:hypothetical protein